MEGVRWQLPGSILTDDLVGRGSHLSGWISSDCAARSKTTSACYPCALISLGLSIKLGVISVIEAWLCV